MQTIRLLGGVAIEGHDGRRAGRVAQRSRLALTAILAVAHPRPVSRERLMAMLWPESDGDRARHLLRDAVYRVRETLGHETLLGTGDDLRLDSTRVECDLWEFKDALTRGDFARADRAYAGPFLDGHFLSDSAEFQQWADAERARLAEAHLRVLESIATSLSESENHAAAVAAWKRLSTADPHNGRVAIRLMEALDVAGDRAGALKHAGLHTALMESDLGAAPDPDVLAYADRLRKAPVLRALASPETTRAAPHSITRETVVRPRRRVFVSVVGMAATIVVLAAATLAWMRQRAPTAADQTSITILPSLPSQSVAADTSAAYVAEGMAEDITSILAKNTGLTVKFSRSALASGDHRAPLREIARELQVANVLTIGVRREGARLRVTAQLTRAADATVTWSEQFDRDPTELFVVQDQIARSIAGALRPRVAAQATSADNASFGTADPAAYDAYLQGRYHLDRRGAANLRLALGYFQRAIDRDPRYARAHAGVSASATLLTLYNKRDVPRDSMLRIGLSAARRAASLDSGLADAHAALGQTLTYLGRRDEAERAYRKAVALDPRNATAHQWFAELLILEGRIDEATAEMELSTKSDPLSGINFAVAANHFRTAGRFEEALRFGARAVELNPTIPAIWEFYAKALFFAGLRDSAERVLARHSAEHAFYAYVRAKNGNRAALDSARHVVERARYPAVAKDGTVPSLGLIALAADDHTAALDALETLASGNPAFPLHNPLIDQVYDPIRDSARFRDIIRKAGLNEQLNLRPRRRR